MKNTIYSVLIWITAAAFVSSCSSGSELTSSSFIKKRKYTKGFHIDFGAKKRDKPSATASLPDAAPARDIAPLSAGNMQPKGPLLTASASDAIDESSAVSTIDKAPVEPESSVNSGGTAISDSPALQSSTELNESRILNLKRAHRKAAANASSAAAAPAASGGSTLLYVIIAIFIPPLAVGLLYGISPEFWISLLLTILFFVPGMIYSIIKVLAA